MKEADKSIEQLENDVWTADHYPSNLVTRCVEYRKIPIGKLNAEQLRMLIGQQIGLKYLVPLALQFLQKDILTTGDYYPGDLLGAVLTVEKSYWKQNPNQRVQVMQLLSNNDYRFVKEHTSSYRKLKSLAEEFIKEG